MIIAYCFRPSLHLVLLLSNQHGSVHELSLKKLGHSLNKERWDIKTVTLLHKLIHILSFCFRGHRRTWCSSTNIYHLVGNCWKSRKSFLHIVIIQIVNLLVSAGMAWMKNEEDTLSLNCNNNSSKVNNMETKSRSSRRISPGQMEAVYHLECWQAGEKAIPLTHTRESSQGIKTII